MRFQEKDDSTSGNGLERKSHILVVDDEIMIQTLLAEVLSEEGYEVTTASNGKEAIELLEKQRFNLVITDIVMPVLNGIEVLLAAKRIDIHYPVIVITGYHSVESVVRLVNLGAADYIAKPFNVDLIRLTVAKVLQMRKLRRSADSDEPTESYPAVDSQTETFNLGMFSILLENEVGRSLRHCRGFSLLMLEISSVKSGAGRANGRIDNEAIRQFSAMLKDEASPGEVIGHTDNAEFTVVLPETSLADAQNLGKRVRRKAEWTFGVNYGVAEFPTHATDAKSLMDAAHTLLKSPRTGAGG